MGGLTEKRIAELRADLKKLAADDFDTFCHIIGMDDTLAYVGLERMKTYRDWETDRKSTRLNSSHLKLSRMPSSA